MKLTLSKEHNPNYLAKIVEITEFTPHPKADRLKLCTVNGCVISTGIDSQPGVYIYFPVECQISDWFLKENSLYREKTLNKNPEKTGFFEAHGRVKCLKLRELASEGLVMPIECLYDGKQYPIAEINTLINTEFDTVDDKLLCKKYVIKVKESRPMPTGKKAKEIMIVDNQFRFHIDTEQLPKNIHRVKPNDLIHISYKVHGTSVIFSNILINKKLSFFNKLLSKIKVPIITTEYKEFCASRKVIKDSTLNPGLQQGFYNVDIWNIANEVVKPYIDKGMTIYAEIVGYLPNGSIIQKDYDYGCLYLPKENDYSTMTPEQMYNKKLFNIYIYRITQTNVDGKVYEYSARQVQDWCRVKLLHPVPQLYYGFAQELFSYENQEIQVGPLDETWNAEFLKSLRFAFNEHDCHLCRNKVPEEGIVLRIEGLGLEVFKLKSLRFLEKESKQLDTGETNIEDNG